MTKSRPKVGLILVVLRFIINYQTTGLMQASSSSTSFYFQLQKELENLPGETAHLEMFPQRARTSEALKLAESYLISAVTMLIYFDDLKHKIILIERQDYDGKHSGQIGFPGGKQEETDEHEMATALRETYEEIGIKGDQITILGKLTDVFIPVSNFLVHPFIGHLNALPAFNIDTREVKSIFTFDIAKLLNEENKIVTDVSVGKARLTDSVGQGSTIKNVPAFLIEEKIIWGATALMLNELKIILKRLYY